MTKVLFKKFDKNLIAAISFSAFVTLSNRKIPNKKSQNIVYLFAIKYTKKDDQKVKKSIRNYSTNRHRRQTPATRDA